MTDERFETTIYSLSENVPQHDDNRRDERHLTLFRVGSISIGERRELCMIRNISSGGMMIRAYCPLTVGLDVSVELKQGEKIPGEVIWIKNDVAGIAFKSEVDVVAILAASANGPRPRMPRVEIRCIVSVRRGSQVYGLLARDISQGGVKVETDRELEIGADVIVTLPGMKPRPGIVRWQSEGCYGITFNTVCSVAELVAWLQVQRDGLRKAG